MGEAAAQFDEHLQLPDLEIVSTPEVPEQTLISVPAEVVRDLKISLIANNPLYYPPSLSRNMRLKHPTAHQALLAPTDLQEHYAPLLDKVQQNPVLITMLDKQHELHEKAASSHLESSRHAGHHQELEESIDVVIRLTIWEILNDVFDPTREESNVDWLKIDTAMQNHFKAEKR